MSEIQYRSELARLAEIEAGGEDISADVDLLARRAAMGQGAVRREIARVARR